MGRHESKDELGYELGLGYERMIETVLAAEEQVLLALSRLAHVRRVAWTA